MEINFPLVLVTLTFVTGLVWLIDALFFAKKRNVIFASEALVLANLQTEKREDNTKNRRTVRAELVMRAEPKVVEFSKSFFPVFLLVLVLRSFLLEPFRIPSASMEPTLLVDDFILVNKFVYGIRLPVLGTKVLDIAEPKRGDVMVFYPPQDKRYFIKRVVGLPGEEVRYANKQVYINGQLMVQQSLALSPSGTMPSVLTAKEHLGDVDHLIAQAMTPYSDNGDHTYLVPQGHYFMMGDNRDNSSDSRVWGFVPEANIVGKAFAVWMHWKPPFTLPSFKRNGRIDSNVSPQEISE